MAASCLDGSSKKNNGIKLSRLLIDGGTFALRKTFDSFHPPANLATSLTLPHNQALLNQLQIRRVIRQVQWNKLFPPSGTAPDSKEFDITLLFILLRNICPGLAAPATGWDALPPEADKSQEADLVRIKFYRNEVYGHIASTEFSNVEFERYWKAISKSLIALGIDQPDIDLLKSSPVGENEYYRLLEDWVKSEQSLREDMKETRKDVKQFEETLQEVLKTIGKGKSEIQKLAKSDFSLQIKSYVDHFDQDTRAWIIKDIDKFIRSETTQVLVLTARPGFGKSILAAVICHNMLNQGQLAACHFIQHGNCLRNKPQVILESLASQLCDTIPGYCKNLEEILSRNFGAQLDTMNSEELITTLLEEPLAKILNLGKQVFVIVIDALDETDPGKRDEFKRSLFNKLSTFPKWIKFVVTIRQSKELEIVSADHVVLNIDPVSADNTNDITNYLKKKLVQYYSQSEEAEIRQAASSLTSRCQGMFLFAHLVTDFIARENIALSQVCSVFPMQLSVVYEKYFERLQKELNVYGVHERNFFSFLRALVACKMPLPEALALSILELGKRKKEAARVLKQLSVLFPMEDGCVTIFHKSVAEWLTEKQDKRDVVEHDFNVNVGDGHKVLANHCFELIKGVKSYANFPPDVKTDEKYALQFGLYHMLEAKECQEQLTEIVQDLELLSAKCFTSLSVIDFITELKNVRQTLDNSLEGLDPLIENLQLGKYVETDPKSCPQVVLQAAVDIPESCQMRKKAIQILQSPKFSRLPWIDEVSATTGEVWDVAVCSTKEVGVCWWKPEGWHTKGCLSTFHIDGMQFICNDNYNSSRINCSPRDISLSPDGKLVLVVTLNSKLELRSASTLKVQRVFKSESDPQKCCFNSNGCKLIAGCSDGKIRLWDTHQETAESVLSEHNERVNLCSSSSDACMLTGDTKGYLVLWKLAIKLVKVCVLTKVWSTTHGSAVFSPDGKMVAAVCKGLSDGGSVVNLFNAHGGTLMRSLQIAAWGPLAFVDDTHVLGKCQGAELGTSHGRVFVVNTDAGNDAKMQYLPCSYSWLYQPHQTCQMQCIDAVRINFRARSLVKFKIHNVK